METEEAINFANSLDAFSRNLYQHLVKSNPNRNLIFSPLSIQTCAGMLRVGAEDGSETAKELDEGLNFSSNYGKEIANGFHNVLTSYEQCMALKMVNKLYLMKDYQTRVEFKDILTQKFHSEAENIDFSASIEAANTINGWIESRTNKVIKNLVSPQALNEDTRLVLVNAIHFKGEWRFKFEPSETQNEDFFLTNENKVTVPMMNTKRKYEYADLAELDAKALRLPYYNNNLSMLIILPNLMMGIKQLETKLKTTLLEDILSDLDLRKVSVKLPKFRAEFEQELSSVFQELGIHGIFTGKAKFGNMLESNESLDVSKILHKAFIEVNEEGTEVAATTAMVVQLRSLPAAEREPKVFHADHPFYYTIYDENHGCLFVGNYNGPDVSAQNVDKVRVICHCSRQLFPD